MDEYRKGPALKLKVELSTSQIIINMPMLAYCISRA